jgi:hypothetical protein
MHSVSKAHRTQNVCVSGGVRDVRSYRGPPSHVKRPGNRGLTRHRSFFKTKLALAHDSFNSTVWPSSLVGVL